MADTEKVKTLSKQQPAAGGDTDTELHEKPEPKLSPVSAGPADLNKTAQVPEIKSDEKQSQEPKVPEEPKIHEDLKESEDSQKSNEEKPETEEKEEPLGLTMWFVTRVLKVLAGLLSPASPALFPIATPTSGLTWRTQSFRTTGFWNHSETSRDEPVKATSGPWTFSAQQTPAASVKTVCQKATRATTSRRWWRLGDGQRKS
ncbi:hypothetical protein FQA47_001568 [Oryzias melastigma]|uniref:Uncharacterized protein n=1 Tax=Oryzias melastigma TaxID=30732 RepID=A0A834L2X2_ORYME|nr:hypothetical protein FQA47_001568 [Oryzias melastigma]